MVSQPAKFGRNALEKGLIEKQKWEEGKMKKKVLLVALLCVFGMATLSIGNANAAVGTFTCTVSAAGLITGILCRHSDRRGWDFYQFSMFYPSGPRKPGMEKAQYAAALTAFANSTNVVAYMDTTSTAIFQLYASK